MCKCIEMLDEKLVDQRIPTTMFRDPPLVAITLQRRDTYGRPLRLETVS